MVTMKQRRDIKELMRAIKDATDRGAPDKEVEKRTKELTDYLHQEGIIRPFDD